MIIFLAEMGCVKLPYRSEERSPLRVSWKGNWEENRSKGENRFKFQGQELQSDLNLNWYQFKYRMHDPALGRFFSVDPLASDYVYNSPYAFSENKVISFRELEGLEATPATGNCPDCMKKVDGNERFWNALPGAAYNATEKTLTLTDINDATVIATWMTRGSDGAINIDGTSADGWDKGAAIAGGLIPVISGHAVKKLLIELALLVTDVVKQDQEKTDNNNENVNKGNKDSNVNSQDANIEKSGQNKSTETVPKDTKTRDEKEEMKENN